MTQQGSPSSLDPVAVYAAITGTVALLIEAARLFLDRPQLTATVSTDFPELDDAGGTGPTHIRIDITNTGRRPITLRVAGLLTAIAGARAGQPASLLDRVLTRNSVMNSRPIAFNTETRLIIEGESWTLHRRANDVARIIEDHPEQTSGVVGVYAITATGKWMRWPATAIKDRRILKLGQEMFPDVL